MEFSDKWYYFMYHNIDVAKGIFLQFINIILCVYGIVFMHGLLIELTHQTSWLIKRLVYKKICNIIYSSHNCYDGAFVNIIFNVTQTPHNYFGKAFVNIIFIPSLKCHIIVQQSFSLNRLFL